MENGYGVESIYTDEPIKQNGIYLYKTFYFKALSKKLKLPDINVTLLDDNYLPIAQNRLLGKELKAIKLNPPSDFCNVLAKSLVVKNFQISPYDKENNLVVLNIEANLSNIEDFHLNFVKKGWFEDFNQTSLFVKTSYFAIVPTYIKKFKFSYFNTQKNRFEYFQKKIEIKNDSVVTQTDIRPSEDSHKIIKILVFFFIAILFLIIAIFKKSFSYLFLAFIFGGYGAYLSFPIKTICIKKGAKVSILPTKNSTIFFISKSRLKVKRLNHIDGYSKIELPNKKIGWVKDEYSCKN